jgi:hypothetical protein
MHRAVYVPLPDNAVMEALEHVSRGQLRHPREQAAWFILDGLRRVGALPTESTTDVTPASDRPAVAAGA